MELARSLFTTVSSQKVRLEHQVRFVQLMLQQMDQIQPQLILRDKGKQEGGCVVWTIKTNRD